jgi:hypothetical protein
MKAKHELFCIKWNLLFTMCVVFFAAPVVGATSTVQEQASNDSDSYWSLEGRTGFIFDRTTREINCGNCNPDFYDIGIMFGADLAYSWDDFQAGLSGTLGGVVFGSEQYSLSATAGWRHDFTSWLQFKALGEVGAHVIDGFASGALFQNIPDDSDFAILPFVGTRLSLNAKIWPAAGLVLGIWASGQMSLVNREQDFRSEGLFDSVDHHTYAVGGHQLSTGVNLGFEF